VLAVRVETHVISIVPAVDDTHAGQPPEPEALETLLVDRHAGVVTITLNRPTKKNAVNDRMWAELRATLDAITRRPEDRVVVITGAGDGFCSGADLTDPSDATHHLARMRTIGDVCLELHRLPQPTIARVNGVAAGAGMNLALACDLIVASTDARFSEIFARRGLSVDFGGSWLLPRLIGLHRAKELVLLADIIDATEAERLGLVNKVVDASQLDLVVADWAGRLADGPPIALAQSKNMLNNAFAVTMAQALDDEGRAQAVNFGTKDTAEAMRAFVEKRPPRFEGR